MYKETMKLTHWLAGEGRWGQIRLGMNGTDLKFRNVLESKDNRYDASVHHHGGVRVVGMLRSGSGKSREIHVRAEERECSEATGATSVKNEGILSYGEVGGVHSSDEALVMRGGAKGLYLVEVNRARQNV